MSKFKVGDKVVGNDSADEKYGVTKKGWVGTVKCYFDDGYIAVESLDHENTYPAHEDYFDKFDSTQHRKIVITEEDQLIRVKVFKGGKFLCEGTEIGDDFMKEARKLLEDCRPKIPELKDGYISGKGSKNMEQYYIIRADRAGVFFGNIKERNGSEVTLTNVRRLWYWDGACSLSQLAVEGTKTPSNCKFTIVVPEMIVLGVIEIIPCSDVAVESIKSVKEWKR